MPKVCPGGAEAGPRSTAATMRSAAWTAGPGVGRPHRLRVVLGSRLHRKEVPEVPGGLLALVAGGLEVAGRPGLGAGSGNGLAASPTSASGEPAMRSPSRAASCHREDPASPSRVGTSSAATSTRLIGLRRAGGVVGSLAERVSPPVIVVCKATRSDGDDVDDVDVAISTGLAAGEGAEDRQAGRRRHDTGRQLRNASKASSRRLAMAITALAARSVARRTREAGGTSRRSMTPSWTLTPTATSSPRP
jgi:hypothetical protein